MRSHPDATGETQSFLGISWATAVAPPPRRRLAAALYLANANSHSRWKTDGSVSAMSPDAAFAMSRMKRLLDGTVNFENEYDSGCPIWSGRPGSMADRELEEAGRLSTPWRVTLQTTLAGLRLREIAVVHHLKSISQLMGDPMPAFGPEILARSVLEAAARTWWIVDPSIGLERRIARGLTDRLYSADYGASLASASGVDTSAFSKPPDNLIARCGELDLTVSGTPRNRRVGLDPVPLATPLCADLLNSIDTDPQQSQAGGAFPYYSAISHGTHYALLHYFHDLGKTEDGEEVLEPRETLEGLLQAVELSLAAFIALFERLNSYFNWPIDLWESWRDHIIAGIIEIHQNLEVEDSADSA